MWLRGANSVTSYLLRFNIAFYTELVQRCISGHGPFALSETFGRLRLERMGSSACTLPRDTPLPLPGSRRRTITRYDLRYTTPIVECGRRCRRRREYTLSPLFAIELMPCNCAVVDHAKRRVSTGRGSSLWTSASPVERSVPIVHMQLAHLPHPAPGAAKNSPLPLTA